MKSLKSVSLFIIVFFIGYVVNAQDDLEAQAPTLQIGLDGFSFTKGTLDAQLIMEIIAEKQQEIKIKAIQNAFLGRVKDAGGTIYSFTNNVVNELVFEPDANVRTKKVLENTVNLAFVVAFLDYYLGSLDTSNREDILNLAESIKEKDNNLKNIGSLRTKTKLSISDFKYKDWSSNSFHDDKNAVEFIALLLDMCSKAVQENDHLKKLGLMQVSHTETYEYMNKYNKLKKDSLYYYKLNSNKFKLNRLQKIVLTKEQKSLFELDSRQAKEIVKKADTVYRKIKSKLDSLTNAIGLVNYFVQERTFRLDKQHTFLKSSDSVKSHTGIAGDVGSLIKNIESLIEELTLHAEEDTVLRREINNLVQIYFYTKKAKLALEDTANYHRVAADILYAFNSEFIPILKRQAYRDHDYITLIEQFNQINDQIYASLKDQNKWLGKDDGKIEINNFLSLVSKLYQFDRATTISEYLNLINEVSTLFPNDNINNALSTVVSFVKDYTVIEKTNDNKEVIAFNAESFIYRLQSIKPYHFSWFRFSMTVGVNNAFFLKDLQLADESVVRNLSFVSEKIGLKFVLKDRAFWHTRNPGETYKFGKTTYTKITPPNEPIVSNYHLLVYGSGLLYNLVNTKTNEEFNMPLLGIGGGITFYNALDLNISWGVPIFPDKSLSTNDSFWNIGFDIQFIEYINRLQEKRNFNKTQKRLAQAKVNK